MDHVDEKYVRNVRSELAIAKEKGFPVFVIYNPELSTNDYILFERYFSGLKIIKTVTRHVDVSISEKHIEEQIVDLFKGAQFTDDLNEFDRCREVKDMFVIIANRKYLRQLSGIPSSIVIPGNKRSQL